MATKCEHLNELLKAQEVIIKRHIDEHKWFQHITDPDKAAVDFIEHYGWIMREVYCGQACKDRANCVIAAEFLPKDPKLYDGSDDPDVLTQISERGL